MPGAVPAVVHAHALRAVLSDMACRERLQRVLGVVLPVRDILEQRVDTAAIPAWCETRDWAPFLLGLSEQSLRECEAHGLASALSTLHGAPADLSKLAHDVTAAT